MRTIDINADLGEGSGTDEVIMPLISSCNIACGGHAGDQQSMRTTLELARRNKVKAGAHPSYPDRPNFGRKVLSISSQDLRSSLVDQLSGYRRMADELQLPTHHVKAHGALYNHAAKDHETANILLDAIREVFGPIKLYLPHGSVLHQLADGRFELCFEAFIDRSYESDGSLRSRSHPDAIIHDPELAWIQLYQMLDKGTVSTVVGTEFPMEADTFCIHSDHPNAAGILQHIHLKLKQHRIRLGR
jgi:UPF0271 protein